MSRLKDLIPDGDAFDDAPLLDYLESLPPHDALREVWELNRMCIATQNWSAVCTLTPVVGYFETLAADTGSV